VQFTHGIGIVITKTELKAVTSFAKGSDDAKIVFRVRDGKLLVWTASSVAAVYHHGPAFDGGGKKATEDRTWQVVADTLRGIEKLMDNDDELVLCVSRTERMTEAKVRVADSSESRMSISLDGHVSEQYDLSLPALLPSRPERNLGEIPVAELVLGWSATSLLKDVAKAAETNAMRYFITSNPAAPVYIEIDKLKNLADESQPAWVCVLIPIDLDNVVKSKHRDAPPSFDEDPRELPPLDSDPVAQEIARRSKKSDKSTKAKAKGKNSEPEAQNLEDFEEAEA
jgi:hypothetical protein